MASTCVHTEWYQLNNNKLDTVDSAVLIVCLRLSAVACDYLPLFCHYFRQHKYLGLAPAAYSNVCAHSCLNAISQERINKLLSWRGNFIFALLKNLCSL